MNGVKFISINTKGHCFFCLREYNSGEERLKSLKILARYLNIEVGNLFKSWNPLVSADKLDVGVYLCENCDKAYAKLSTIFQLLELLQMEMDYSLKEMQKTIKASSLDLALKEKYHNKMDSDLGALLQLEISDRLRDILQNKCTKEAGLGKMFVKIKQIKAKAEIKPVTALSVPIIKDFPGRTYDDSIMNQNLPKASVKSRKIPRQTRRIRRSFKKLKRLQCKICYKRYSSPSDLKLHYSFLHLGVRFFCTVSGCGKATQGYSRRDSVWKHMRAAHTDLFPNCKSSFKEMVHPNFTSGTPKSEQHSNSSVPIIMEVWSEDALNIDYKIERDNTNLSDCKIEQV